MNEIEAIQAILLRERRARKAAEQIIEEKARELYFANESLRGMNESLEESIKQRTEEYLLAKEKAEEATRAKSDFLSSMSHEIRTPLNAISGLSDLIERDAVEPEIREYAGIVKDSVAHLLSIINEILDFSKIESGKFDLEPEDFAIKDIRNQILHTFSPLAERKGIEFSVQFDPKIPLAVWADRTKLLQVWINLIGNALKFTEKGSVAVSLVLLKKKENTYWLRGSVKDTGIGIPKKDQAKVFLPFEQSEQVSEQKMGGTGLGLAISFRVIELMGGKMELVSEVGRGSEFAFTFPLREGNREVLQQKAKLRYAEEKNLLNELRVLVVDDMEMNRFLMKKVLMRVNAKPVFAENGAIALDILRQQSFDIVLMDLHMPVMDGIAATKAIRAEHLPHDNPHVPIIALTADAFKHTNDAVIEAGMNDFLPKPIDIDALYNKLKDLL
ncbi:MAG: ATP-binding protein [Bacteroidia bacterium]|nr:ATP-binding protein [Bacteroidia bacterium]